MNGLELDYEAAVELYEYQLENGGLGDIAAAKERKDAAGKALDANTNSDLGGRGGEKKMATQIIDTNIAFEDRKVVFLNAVIDALKERGHELDAGGHVSGIYKIDGICISFDITGYGNNSSFITARSRSTQLCYKVGAYGDRTVYPEPKKGFDIAKVMERIEAKLNVAKVQRERKAKESEAKDIRHEVFSKACLSLGFSKPNHYSVEQNGKFGGRNVCVKETHNENEVSVAIRIKTEELETFKLLLSMLNEEAATKEKLDEDERRVLSALRGAPTLLSNYSGKLTEARDRLIGRGFAWVRGNEVRISSAGEMLIAGLGEEN